METVLQRWSWVALLAAAALCALLAARIVNTFAAEAIAPRPALVLGGPSGTRAPEAPHLELNQDRLSDAFGIPRPPPPPPPGETVAKVEPQRGEWNSVPVRSALRGVLVGTAIAEPARWSLCQLTNSDTNETLVYAVGDRFLSARIYRVEKDRVLLDNEGRNEYIDNSAAGAAPNLGVAALPPPPSQGGGDGVKQLSENAYAVSKKEIDKALNNLSELATQARIVPSFKNGVSNGFKLFSIVPDSLYSKIGVQNGDVIHKINGYEMNSPDKALEIYQKLRDATRIEIELERRGESIRKQYSIE